jgi:hypothetical protein
MVVWQASGTIGYIYQPLNPNNEIPFPVSAGESVTLDMTVDTTEQGYISTPGQETYDNVVSATMNLGGHVFAFTPPPYGTTGFTNVDYNMPFGTSQYLNGIAMTAEDYTSKITTSWYLQTVGGLNSTPLTSSNMLSQPPSLTAFQTVGMEIWPYEGDQYQFEFLASIDNLTVTPMPLPSSVVTLLSGLLLVIAVRSRLGPHQSQPIAVGGC